MTVDIRARAAGFVRATASDFHGRRVILVDAQGEDLAGALSPSDGHTIAAGARYALDQRLPLVILLASSGSNLEEGVGALDGWGGAAR
jgi:acetyl-CoA carboxylase carboxyltransferase component